MGLGGSYISEDGSRSIINTKEGAQALDVVRRLGVAQQHTPPLWFPELTDGGKLAMFFGSLWTPPYVMQTAGGSWENLLMLSNPLPKFPDASKRYAVDEPIWFVVNKASPNVEAAWKFLVWTSTGERVLDRFHKTGYFLPRVELMDFVMESGLGHDPLMPFLQKIALWQEESEIPLPLAKHAISIHDPVFREPVPTGIQDAYYDRKSIDQILSDLEQAINNRLTELGMR